MTRSLFFLLAAIAACSAGLVDFNARTHHKLLKSTDSVGDAESIVLKTLKERIGTSVHSVRIGETFMSRLDTRTFTFDAVLTVEDSITREALLTAVHTDEDVHGLRFLKLSKPSPHVEAPLVRSRRQANLIEIDPTTPDCSSHGIRLPNRTCVCDSFWSGDQCDSYNCFDGVHTNGISDLDERCACPPGRFGTHCQPKSCSSPVADNLSFDRRSISIVLSLKRSMARDLQALVGDIGSAMAALVKDRPDTYNHFMLMTFNAFHGFTAETTYDTSDLQEFQDQLTQIVISQGDDQQPIVSTLYYAINNSPLINPRSIVLLFADSEPSDATDINNSNEEDSSFQFLLVQQILAWRHQLIITLTQPSTLLNASSTPMKTLRQITDATHGDFVLTNKKTIGTVAEQVIADFDRSENIYIQPPFPCAGTSMNVTVPVDVTDLPYRVFFTGSSKVTVTASAKIGGTSQNIVPEMTVDNFAIYNINNSLTFISFTIPAAEASPVCSFRIAATKTDDKFLASFSADSRIDVGLPMATQGVQQQLSLLPMNARVFYSVDVLDASGAVIETSVKIVKRNDTCAFPYSAPLTSTCSPGPFSLRVSARNTDTDTNAAMTRIIPAFCAKPVDRKPTSFTCLNGGTYFVSPDGVEYCDCPRLYNGDHCEVPQCHNGAVRNPFPTAGDDHTLCLCKPGWAGIHCETLANCYKEMGGPFNVTNKVLSIIMQASFSQAYIAEQLVAGLHQVKAKYPLYQLVTFNEPANSPQQKINITTATTIKGLVDLINAAKFQYSSEPMQESIQAVMKAASALQAMNPVPGVIFILFTDTDDYSGPVEKQEAQQSFAALNAALHIVRTPQFDDGCSDPPQDTENIIFEGFTKWTGGVFIDMCKSGYKVEDIAQIVRGIADHAPTTQLADVQFANEDDCSSSPRTVAYTSNSDRKMTLRITTDEPNTLGTIKVIRVSDSAEVKATQSVTLPTLAEIDLPMPQDPADVTDYTISVTFTKSTGCSLYVLTDSDDSLHYGFTVMGTTDLQSAMPQYGYPFAPIIHIQTPHPSNLPPGASIIAYDNDGNVTYDSRAGELREKCSYELLWPPLFSCPEYDSPFMYQPNIDHRRFSYVKRTFFPFCRAPTANCAHGKFDQWGDTCDCTNTGYTGDWCQIPQCINGGTADNAVCKCPAGYTGTFCEYTLCDSLNFAAGKDPRMKDFRSVTFVMETTYNALIPNGIMSDHISELIEQIETGGQMTYTLVTYDDLSFSVAASSAASKKFITEFQRALSKDNLSPAYPNYTKAFDAIDSAIDLDVDSPTLLVAFVQAASRPDFATLKSVMEKRPGVQVNIIYNPLSSSSTMLPTSSPFFYYDAAALISEGRVLPSTQNGTVNLPKVISSWISENSLIGVQGTSKCDQGFSFQFNAESQARRLVITLVGSGIDISSTTVTRNNASILNYDNILFTSDSTLVLQFIPTGNEKLVGAYNVTTKTSKGRCLIQAREESAMRTDIAFVTNIHNDYPNSAAFSASAANSTLKSTHIVASVPAGYAVIGHGGFDKATLYSFDISTGNVMKKSEIVMNERDPGRPTFGSSISCAYQFISDAFQFTDAYTLLVLTGSSQMTGEAMQRAFLVATQQPLKCLHGSNSPTGECQCTSGFTGEQCDVALCANQGTASGDICLCRSGYNGGHCEGLTSSNISTATTTVVPPPSTSTTLSSVAPTSTKATPSADCHPESTTYNILVLVENSSPGFDTPQFASDLLNSLAATFSLGKGGQKTFFAVAGANSKLHLTGKEDKKDQIDSAIDKIIDSFDGSDMDLYLGKTITEFQESLELHDFTDEKPIAIVISGVESTDDPSYPAAQLKQDNGFSIIGVAINLDAEASLRKMSNDVISTSHLSEVEDFIRKTVCRIKPGRS